MTLDFEKSVKAGVEQAMKECELTIGMSLKAAVEKQIPKKPRQACLPNYYWCPDCEKAIKKRIEHSIKIISHCPFCGQKLDWESEGEE